jgi:hypothetical protein
VELLRAPRLRRYSWLAHGFSTRQPDELNLSYSSGSAPAVVRNRQALLHTVRGGRRAVRWQLVTLRQRHTDIIQVVHKKPRGRAAASERGWAKQEQDGAVKLLGDALITNQPGVLLAVQVADCLPILLADTRKRVVAAVHAGWRGTAKRITQKTVGRMQQEFGCDPKTTVAALGPGIHACCYQVGPEVVEVLESQFPYGEKIVRRQQPSPTEARWQQPLFSPAPQERRPRPAVTASAGAVKFFLDLVEANRRQLRAAGLKAGNIWASPLCTACRTDLFFSHRAEQGRTGRMMGVVGLVR